MRYRKNVAAFIINHQGQILTCERLDFPGSWQLPQGGVDDGEEIESALWRELREEIGTDYAEILDSLLPPLSYDWPDEIRAVRGFAGQEQFFYLLRLKNGAKIVLDSHTPPEFAQVVWLDSSAFADTVSGFKRDNYLAALEMFRKRNPGIIS